MKWMHDAGYRTGLIGKFLNGYSYPDGDAAWVLPGVDEWDAFLLEPINQSHNGCDQLGYWATCYSHNGTLEKHGADEYSTTTSGDKAVQFIESTPADQPLFLYYAPRAPHLPTLPDTEYANACPTSPKLDPPSFNTQIVNAPAYMQRPPFSKKLQKFFAKKWLADCQTLLSVDDQVGNIVTALQDTGRLDNTLIMFASDNGWLFGEHRWKGKIVPYQEADQVPVIIRWDALGTQPTQVGDLVTNMDYTSTFLAAAGVSPRPGTSWTARACCHSSAEEGPGSRRTPCWSSTRAGSRCRRIAGCGPIPGCSLSTRRANSSSTTRPRTRSSL